MENLKKNFTLLQEAINDLNSVSKFILQATWSEFRPLERHEEDKETHTDEIDCVGIKFLARDGEFVSTSQHAMFV